MLWWQKCLLTHILIKFLNILIFLQCVGLAEMSKPSVELLHFGFYMSARLIAFNIWESNDAVTIYVHCHHTFQHICHASARLPAFPSTMLHIPSSLEGMRSHKALNGYHLLNVMNELG